MGSSFFKIFLGGNFFLWLKDVLKLASFVNTCRLSSSCWVRCPLDSLFVLVRINHFFMLKRRLDKETVLVKNRKRFNFQHGINSTFLFVFFQNDTFFAGNFVPRFFWFLTINILDTCHRGLYSLP